LSLVATGDRVVRDMFYDGNPQAEPGAIVCRVAESFLRFGNFELPSSRGDVPLLKKLVDFTLAHWFPRLRPQGGSPSKETYAAFLREVSVRTARLIAHWQAVGFVHGVMNTDNLSILGLTIDYGPYGWTDHFDLGWTPNTTDASRRRYSFGNQPGIGLWNVERLGIALLPLFDGDEKPVHEAIDVYQRTYAEEATRRFAQKIGLVFDGTRGDGELLQQLLDWLQEQETDMTLFFRALSKVAAATAPSELPASVRAAFYRQVPEAHEAKGLAWLQRWWRRLRDEQAAPPDIARAMDASNPKFVLRNWLAQEAIDAAQGGDLSKVDRLLEVMQRPFDEQPEHEDLAQKRPDWARDKPGCSALSCSS
jgi:uncharacterized protein YdiU (UPF0061 family)